MSTAQHCYVVTVAESTDMTIGENVRRFREALGLSQAQLAQRLTDSGLEGFHPQTVLRVEKGMRPLRLAEALVFAEALSVEVAALSDLDPTRAEQRAHFLAIKDAQDRQIELRDAYNVYWGARGIAMEVLDAYEARLDDADATADEVQKVRGQIAELRRDLPKDAGDVLQYTSRTLMDRVRGVIRLTAPDYLPPKDGSKGMDQQMLDLLELRAKLPRTGGPDGEQRETS